MVVGGVKMKELEGLHMNAGSAAWPMNRKANRASGVATLMGLKDIVKCARCLRSVCRALMVVVDDVKA